MRNLPIGCTALRVVVIAVALAAPRLATGAPGPADIATHRQEILNDMLTEAYQPALIANLRRSCALGGEPANVAQRRAGGAYFTPDAADACVTALVRTARDRRLPDLYRGLSGELGGRVDVSETLPHAIGAGILNGTTKVAIGNRKAAEVTPALAFDAGFTVAYLDGVASAEPVNVQQLRAVAEDCLGQRRDAATCFSVGHMYGARMVGR